MGIRSENIPLDSVKDFLLHCYRYVSHDWQHSERILIPDQGFERRFRELCIAHLQHWTISQEREMSLGQGLSTASGVLHEIDIVAQYTNLHVFVELKNRSGLPPDKNDVIVFFAKLLDYLAFNPDLLLKEICPVLISSTTFEYSGLAACIGLGIHPVAPQLRPLPILFHNAICLNAEIEGGLILDAKIEEMYEDFCAQINLLSTILNETWISSRCGRLSETKLVIQAAGGLDTQALASDLRQVNADCSRLIHEFREAKKRLMK